MHAWRLTVVVLACSAVLGCDGFAELGLDAGASVAAARPDAGALADAGVEPAVDAGVDAGVVDSGVPAPEGPSNLRGFVGGRDVALIWDGVAGATGYRVYRDGALAGTALPRPSGTRFSANATYVDASVTPGVTYAYAVEAVFAEVVSQRSATITVTHASKGTPVPVITLDASADPSLQGYLAAGKAFLETWYPKLGDALAAPDYAPPTAFTLRIVAGPCPDFAAYADGLSIVICSTFAKSDPDDLSLFAHEATHVLQAYPSSAHLTGMVVEGIASWGGDWATGYVQPPPPPGSLYTDGYGTAEYLFNWAAARYQAPSLVRAINASAHAGTYSDTLFKSLTGRSLGQLWSEMSGEPVSTPGRLKGPLGKCADLSFYDTTDGTALTLLTCRTSGGLVGAQEVISIGRGAAMTWLLAGKCIGVDAQSNVVLQTCSGATGQLWRAQSGALVSQSGGRCLQPRQAATAESTPLVVAACNGSAAQAWTAPVPGE